jgi:uncharacterized phage protein (TIGR02218 family)
LSVDNSEALGVLRDDAIDPVDLRSGRYDGARVHIWRVNWRDVSQRTQLFTGIIGDTVQAGAGFRAKILGLTDLLARPIGRVYQIPCSAVLGDRACQVGLDSPSYTAKLTLPSGLSTDVLSLPSDLLAPYAPGWFTHGALRVQSGVGAGLWAPIKSDSQQGDLRRITLWAPLPQPLAAGIDIALQAGCDKRAVTCRVKFDNILNYQGFPDMPAENYTLQTPAALAAAGGAG